MRSRPRRRCRHGRDPRAGKGAACQASIAAAAEAATLGRAVQAAQAARAQRAATAACRGDGATVDVRSYMGRRQPRRQRSRSSRRRRPPPARRRERQRLRATQRRSDAPARTTWSSVRVRPGARARCRTRPDPNHPHVSIRDCHLSPRCPSPTPLPARPRFTPPPRRAQLTCATRSQLLPLVDLLTAQPPPLDHRPETRPSLRALGSALEAAPGVSVEQRLSLVSSDAEADGLARRRATPWATPATTGESCRAARISC